MFNPDAIYSWPDKYRVSQSLRRLSSQQWLFTCLWKYIQIEILLVWTLRLWLRCYLTSIELQVVCSIWLRTGGSCSRLIHWWRRWWRTLLILPMFSIISVNTSQIMRQIQENKISGLGVLLVSGSSDGSLLQSKFKVSSKRILVKTQR